MPANLPRQLPEVHAYFDALQRSRAPAPLPDADGDFLEHGTYVHAPAPYSPAAWGPGVDVRSWDAVQAAGQADPTGAWLLTPALVDASFLEHDALNAFPFPRPHAWGQLVQRLADAARLRKVAVRRAHIDGHWYLPGLVVERLLQDLFGDRAPAFTAFAHDAARASAFDMAWRLHEPHLQPPTIERPGRYAACTASPERPAPSLLRGPHTHDPCLSQSARFPP